MPGDLKNNEWRLLKDQFNALAHDENVREGSAEMLLDDRIRRRFGEWITWAVERNPIENNDPHSHLKITRVRMSRPRPRRL